MASFHFKAVSADGRVRTGVLSGASEKHVAAELRRQGLTPVWVGAQPRRSWQWKRPSLGGGRRRDVLFFTQELSSLLSAGVPLDRALSITAELSDHAQFRWVVQDVLRLLKSGKSLSDSLAAHPSYFSDLYVNMVRAGEASGALAQIFERLAEFEQSRQELRSYLISSMMYPALLTLVGLGSIVVLVTFVVPRFAAIFEESQMRVPLPAQILIAASDSLRAYGWLALAVAAAAVLATYSYVRTAPGRLWWDSFKLRLPLLGPALRRAETARFARAMATLVANAVPLVQSLGIAASVLHNRRIAGSLDRVAQGVKRGEGIAGPLARTGQFPPLAAHLLTVGEETGRLDQVFARMADIYEGETRAAVKRFTALFEPLIILVMGVLVGALILSMLLAITSINEVAV
ncbi:MAG: type II secretion system F family protein [Bryobacterales bacterium]|nr:type II secretion system F family protein [Bryobacteraceae bacterium]MDW8354438.1 type II secretion system F family protein [Bryobacterales bacterium]